jgi:mono/diheme cytochrome c family protein
MPDLTPALFAASTPQVIGVVIAVIAVAIVVLYAASNIRAGRREVGAELELAANLKPYYDDDQLETKKLDRALTAGLAGLVLVGVGLPAYWLAEPGRQEGAEEEFGRIFVSRGEEIYTEGAQCNSCHGPEGVGGVASHTILDDDNEFVAQVNWKAPALNNVLLRYDEEEVYYILEYGRPYSPMPAWGEGGGGPLTPQQLDNIIDYLESIQISHDESVEAIEGELRTVLELEEGEEIDYTDLRTGEALFNLGEESGFAGGAYACARCHTRGWSIEAGSAAPANADLDLYVDYPDGSGAYGPQLRNGIVPRQFASVEDLAEFLFVGAERGVPYGLNGLSGDGMMPGFGDNPNTEDDTEDGMLTLDMVTAIARYVESLGEAE